MKISSLVKAVGNFGVTLLGELLYHSGAQNLGINVKHVTWEILME